MKKQIAKHYEKLSIRDANRTLPIVRDILEKHIGKESAITTSEITRQVKEKYGIIIHPAMFRHIIHTIRVEAYPANLCACRKGYYIAATRNELHEFVKSLQTRSDNMTEALDAMKMQLLNWSG